MQIPTLKIIMAKTVVTTQRLEDYRCFLSLICVILAPVSRKTNLNWIGVSWLPHKWK